MTITDAELRCAREQMGMPVVVLAELTGYKVDDIAAMEHGTMAVPEELVTKLNKIQEVTADYIDRLVEESKARGFVLTVRFNGELVGLVPEYADFGSMWHRSCAMEAQVETGLPIQYTPKRDKVRI